MTEENTVTYGGNSQSTTIATIAAPAAVSVPKRRDSRVNFFPGDGCSLSRALDPAAGRQVREEGEYYVPDLLTDEEHEADPAVVAAADAETEGLREAMRWLDEAENLVAVLIASMEEEGDARAAQAETVLKIVRKKIDKAHNRVDTQDSRYTNLFLAYFELKAQSEKGAG